MSKIASVLTLAFAGLTFAADAPVTFNKDIAPVLQKNCQPCHRPGSIAPMSFVTYKDARPWAKAMKTAVASRKMPPWFADPKHGRFLNDHSLKQSEIAAIAQWADNGAPKAMPRICLLRLSGPKAGRCNPMSLLKDQPTTFPRRSRTT